MRKPAAAASVAFHGAAILLLLSLRFYPPPSPGPRAEIRFISISAPPPIVAKAGGGGQRQPLPASRGRAPKPEPRQFTIPPTLVNNLAPKLTLQTAVPEAPDVNIDSPTIGDPLGRIGAPSGGLGGPWGIGDLGSGGVGEGPGGPEQGTGTTRSVVKLTRAPQVIYKEEPEYSDEARKAHFEGTVILAFDVDTSGRAINIRVVRGLGLSLDEKAIAAVTRWKFRPAVAGDRTVIAPAEVQVTFRLL
jgi:periplasmic protein TonB